MKKFFFNLLVLGCFLLINTPTACSQAIKIWEAKLTSDFPSVRDIAISPNQDEIFFTVDDLNYRVACLVYIKKNRRNKWTKPKVASFSGHFRDIEPFFSQDGKKLFFASNRPLNKDAEQPKDYDIWYVYRNSLNEKWSEPINLGAVINSSGDEYYPSLSKGNHLYFTSSQAGTKGNEDIFVSRLINEKYTKPQSLSDRINTSGFEFNAFIAPDEDYLIFTSQRKGEGMGRGDLYISFNKNNEWSQAALLNQFNSSAIDYCPFVDEKNGKIYFTSKRNDFKNYYKEKLTIKKLKRMHAAQANGSSRIYTADFDSNIY